MRVRVSIDVPKSVSVRVESTRSEEVRLLEEAFRTLRSNLLLRVREGDKTFLFTSAKPGEGKSTIVVNLAHVLAACNRKVLLVDADLRRPRLHDLFGIPNQQGLTDLLTGALPAKMAYQTVGDGLTVLTSGPVPRDPQNLLLGGRLENFVSLTKNDFDMVLFDSAPVLAFADTMLLAPKMDGLILVLKAGEVTTTEAILVRERLRSVQAKLVGCVLSCVSHVHLQPYHPYTSEYVDEVAPESKLGIRSIESFSSTHGAES